jgi:thymidine phosphorylase
MKNPPAAPAEETVERHGGNALRLKRIAIDTFRENVAYMHRDCEIYRAEGFQALAKIEVTVEGGTSVLAVLNVVDDSAIIAADELGLSEQAFDQLDAATGALVRIDHARPPTSMDAVRRKMMGERLGQPDFDAIITDLVESRYSKMEIAAFLVASGEGGLDRDEVLYLTRAMLGAGERLDWNEPLVADKHCIGGIPGNRTSMVVVPIIAAHGMLIPKTSSRAITSPAGTADTMEVLAKVDLDPDMLHQVVHRHRGCLVWGGTAKLAPADDVMISVERPLGIDSPQQMVASILSKKLAAGSNHLLIDIPVGPTAKVRQMREALALRKLFEFVADRLGVHLQVLISDGRQPIGRGIGPVLEARDVMAVLRNDIDAAVDLRQHSLQIAGRILEFDPDVRGGQGYAIARDILESGRALARMEAIIDAQGRQQQRFETGRLQRDMVAETTGHVVGIDNQHMARIARLSGAPMSKGAGVELLAKLGDEVTHGSSLYRIYAEYPSDFEFACACAERNSGFQIVSGIEPEPGLFRYDQ